MSEIVKGLGKFLGRDVMYVLGGITFLLSILYAVGIMKSTMAYLANSSVMTAYALGVSYVIGYINQEILSLTPVLTTSRITNPNSFLRWIYRSFTHCDFNLDADIEYTNEIIRLRTVFTGDQLEDFERVVVLKHIGSSVGANWLFASLILIGTFLVTENPPLMWGVSLYLLFSSVLLITLAWLKGMQQYVIINNLIQQACKMGTKPKDSLN